MLRDVAGDVGMRDAHVRDVGRFERVRIEQHAIRGLTAVERHAIGHDGDDLPGVRRARRCVREADVVTFNVRAVLHCCHVFACLSLSMRSPSQEAESLLCCAARSPGSRFAR